MSHFTVVRTEIRDLETLEEAVIDLGLGVKHDTTISSWYTTQRVPLACLYQGRPCAGFVRQNDGTYGIVADWWYVGKTLRLSREDFTNKILQRYAYRKVKKALEEQGFRILNESVDAQKSICLQVARWR